VSNVKNVKMTPGVKESPKTPSGIPRTTSNLRSENEKLRAENAKLHKAMEEISTRSPHQNERSVQLLTRMNHLRQQNELLTKQLKQKTNNGEDATNKELEGYKEKFEKEHAIVVELKKSLEIQKKLIKSSEKTRGNSSPVPTEITPKKLVFEPSVRKPAVPTQSSIQNSEIEQLKQKITHLEETVRSLRAKAQKSQKSPRTKTPTPSTPTNTNNTSTSTNVTTTQSTTNSSEHTLSGGPQKVLAQIQRENEILRTTADSLLQLRSEKDHSDDLLRAIEKERQNWELQRTEITSQGEKRLAEHIAQSDEMKRNMDQERAQCGKEQGGAYVTDPSEGARV